MYGGELMEHREWFSNAGGFSPALDLEVLERGLASGLLDMQDEWGMTALSLAVMSGWLEGVQRLLEAGANTELRYHRTGETPLYMAAQERNEAIIQALLAAGANPDGANHYGVTPREWSPETFEGIAPGDIARPGMRIQNAEHLADHYYPRFQIPERSERESLSEGQAVNLYVYGPKDEGKNASFKVRICQRIESPDGPRYVADVETPLEETHLPAGTTQLEFGPEHVATVYVKRPTS